MNESVDHPSDAQREGHGLTGRRSLRAACIVLLPCVMVVIAILRPWEAPAASHPDPFGTYEQVLASLPPELVPAVQQADPAVRELLARSFALREHASGEARQLEPLIKALSSIELPVQRELPGAPEPEGLEPAHREQVVIALIAAQRAWSKAGPFIGAEGRLAEEALRFRYHPEPSIAISAVALLAQLERRPSPGWEAHPIAPQVHRVIKDIERIPPAAASLRQILAGLEGGVVRRSTAEELMAFQAWQPEKDPR